MPVPVVAHDYGRYPEIAAFSVPMATITVSVNSKRLWQRMRMNSRLRLSHKRKPMSYWLILVTLVVLAVGCQTATNNALPIPTVIPTTTGTPLAGFDPTDPEIVFGDGLETSPLFQPVQPELLVSVSSLADLPGNIATGEIAADFEAHLVGGDTFTLAEQRGTTVLIIPTALGCAECVTNLRNLADVYPDYRGRGLRVLVLDLVVGDAPDVWQRFADYLTEPDILWSVAASPQFAVDYDILNLGTVLLVDAAGNLAFRNENPLSADGFRQLLDLATATTANTPHIDTVDISPLPTHTPPSPTPVPRSSATPEPGGFADLPGNMAAGETAVDFTIRDMNDETFNLSDRLGNYVLLLPTAPDCGECMIHLNMLDAVYPDYQGKGVQVILLNLYPDDSDYWAFLAAQFSQMDYTWGTAVSESFVLDYEITTLGTIILVDPAGHVVFRSNDLLSQAHFRQLFERAMDT